MLDDRGCFRRVDLHPADRVQAEFGHAMASFQPTWISSLFMGRSGHEAEDHRNLHHEPVCRAIRMQVRPGEEDEEDQRHPAIHAELEGDDRKGIGLDGGPDGLKRRKMAHGLNAEVLKDDAQGPGCEKVEDEAGPQGGAEKGDGEGEERKLDDHVRKRAA